MKILITGANGMLGEECVKLLCHTNNIIACDLQEKSEYGCNAEYRQLDIADKNAVTLLIEDIKPDVIINCAAFTNVDASELDHELAWSINAGGVRNILDTIDNSNCHLVHISSDYVFDGSDGPYAENQPTKPINYYGQTKLDAELFIQKAHCPWTIIRTNVLYGGTTAQKASFVSWVIEKLQRFETISIVNDQFGNPTWSLGLAQAIRIVIDKKACGLYHYAGKDYISRFEFALKIAGVYGLDPMLIRKTTTRMLNQKAPRPYRSGLTCEKIKKELKVPFYSIIESLNLMKGKK